MLELEVPDRASVLQPADPAGEGEVEELGQLGTDLPGLTVDGIAAEEDEIEGAGDAVDLGHSLDREELLRKRFDAARLDAEHDEGSNHLANLPFKAALTSGP